MLRNVSKHLPVYTASHPTRPETSPVPPSELSNVAFRTLHISTAGKENQLNECSPQQNAAVGLIKTLARRYGSVDRTTRDGRQWTAGLLQTASGLAGGGKQTIWRVRRMGAHSET